MNKFLIPKNYLIRIKPIIDLLLFEPFYKEERYRDIEKSKFESYGFNQDEGEQEINQILKELGKDPLKTQQGMGSIHWVLFSCIKQISNIKNILEIGTYDGETSLILSKLFPDSKITTIDLPPNDPIFATSYGRQNEKFNKDFNTSRDKNLSQPNINYIERNSFFLLDEVSNGYDLIWVDAGHLYPEISWDICNSYHLCNQNGWILCDDIVTHKNGLRDELVSPDSYLIWEYINKRIKDDVVYFLKRNNPKFSANPKKRKYVSLLKKTA